MTTGASNDFQKATELARRMVTQYGMSELGPIQFGRGNHQVFLGRDFGEERNYSEEVASKIDGEVRRIIESCYEHGRKILTDNWEKVERMVESLLEYETVEAEEVRSILGDKPFDRNSGGSAVAAATRAGETGRRAAARKAVAHSAENLAGTRMKQGALVAALALAAVSLAPFPAPAADQSGQSGTLPHGGSYIIYRDVTIGNAAIDLWFRAPGAGYDNSSPGISRLAVTAVAAAPLESGKSLLSFVRGLGGRLTINVYPDIVGVSAIVPADAARRAVAAMTSAYFSPAIDDNALKSAQRDLAVLGVQKRYSFDQLLHDQLFERIFASGAAHYPPIPNTVPDITKIPLADVTSFAHRAFRSGNATLTLTGNIDPSFVGAVTAGNGGGGDAPIDSVVATSPPAQSVVPSTVPGVGMAWVGPAIADERSATAMDFIADYLFREDTGVFSKAVDRFRRRLRQRTVHYAPSSRRDARHDRRKEKRRSAAPRDG